MPTIAPETPREKNIAWEIAKYTILSLLIVIPLRIFVAQPYFVSGQSMSPTFQPNEYVVVDELSYRFHRPERGDVIIFEYPLDPSVDFIKRVIGLPGEQVKIDHGVVFIKPLGASDFTRLNEPYLGSVSNESMRDAITLAKDEYFMMGDNRQESSDSRVWGPLQQKFIIGKAYMRLFPLSRASYLPGKATY